MVSLTIILPSDNDKSRVSTLEKSFDTHFTLRISRVVSPKMRGPLGIITEARLVNGRIVIIDRFYDWDSHKGWQETSGKLVRP